MTRPLTLAVTGLNATDNPGPGVAVIRCLRRAFGDSVRIIGLTYDTLDPGLYAQELGLAAAYLLPYPSQGAEALAERLRGIHQDTPIDVLIPTLDSELPSFISLADELRELGIGTFLPTREQFEMRSKVKLAELGQRAGIAVPVSKVISEERQLHDLHHEVGYPLMVKGVFYGAQFARSLDEALLAFRTTAAKWGVPVIVQRFHAGEEYDVVAVGDGEGGLVGAVAMKKMFLTDKGKAWAGVTVRDPQLLEMTSRFMQATRWRGPCEVEVLRTDDGRYLLLEVNPRFPAWTYLSAGAGQNLPWAVAQLANGSAIRPLPSYRAGVMFVRIALDQIAEMATFQELATTGELHASAAPAVAELPQRRLPALGGAL